MDENKPVVTTNLLDVRQPFEAKELIANIKEAILGGTIPPLEGYTVLKRMAKISEEVLKDKDIKELAEKEWDKYAASGKVKSIDLFSAKICKTATYTFYDFKECQHEVLDALYDIQLQVNEAIKQLEAELKLLIPSETQQSALFGIDNNNKEMVFPTMPTLTWNDYGVIGTVKPPKKIQTIGLKYMKI